MPKNLSKREQLALKAKKYGIDFEVDVLQIFGSLSKFMSDKRATELIERMSCPADGSQLEIVDVKKVAYITFRPNFCLFYFCDKCEYWWEYDVDTGLWKGKKPGRPQKVFQSEG